MSPPTISVCVLAGHGAEALETFLRSLRAQIAPPKFEVLAGGRLTAELVALVQRYFPAAQLFDTGRHLPGAARNALIERARGELLLFLDDDVTAPPELLRRLVEVAVQHPEASVFGGPNETPPASSRFQVVQGAVLSSVVGTGPVCRRYGSRHPGSADERWFTLCNLAVRRHVMRPFLSHLRCAEENALLSQLRSAGEHMRYEPSLRVFHERRATPRSFAQQMFKYGYGRGQLLVRHPRTFRAAYLAPTAMLSYVLLLPLLIGLSGRAALALAPLALYGALTIATALSVARTLHRIVAVPLAVALVVTVHAWYGCGVLRGLLSHAGRRGRSATAEPTASPQEESLDPAQQALA